MTDKKELKKKYKEMIPEMGVFQIRNRESGKILIARALDIRAAINSCRYQLKHGLFHQNAQLQQDFQRLGDKGFDFEVLDRLEAKKEPITDPRPTWPSWKSCGSRNCNPSVRRDIINSRVAELFSPRQARDQSTGR